MSAAFPRARCHTTSDYGNSQNKPIWQFRRLPRLDIKENPQPKQEAELLSHVNSRGAGGRSGEFKAQNRYKMTRESRRSPPSMNTRNSPVANVTRVTSALLTSWGGLRHQMEGGNQDITSEGLTCSPSPSARHNTRKQLFDRSPASAAPSGGRRYFDGSHGLRRWRRVCARVLVRGRERNTKQTHIPIYNISKNETHLSPRGEISPPTPPPPRPRASPAGIIRPPDSNS
ncbi:hypothetical protein EVAR_83431_1 [Eumeta japonica]|uniref:Uncharacterized protein n=1 Tax=Eumeta variegata TaxID=151549 RepID=A0A4C1TYW2_EUMVA|nr:hypothetical protein EVAR_83431_1 [Eumeta japonica]